MKNTILNVKRPVTIPKENCPDSTIKLLTEGYLYIPTRIRRYQSELFQTRLFGQKIICMSGERAAKIFYDQDLFTRKGAIPKRIQETLFGKKGIQTMDGAAHMDRKLMFLSLMTPEKINDIIRLTKKQWRMNSRRFETKSSIVLFDEAAKLLFHVACKWAGVPIYKSEIRQKAEDMSAMIDAFGAIGPRHIIGRCARNRSESWAITMIKKVRAGQLIAPTDSALYAVAWHKNLNGRLMDTKTAAIELINILRPITAIATYVTFGALALNMHPECRQKLQQDDDIYLTNFVQEIRRYYPFGPFLGARVRNEFKWQDHVFRKNDLVLLDIYGTNHDPNIWREPNIFRPERFEERTENPFDFIPQGGGDAMMGTRCPGEWLTIELLKVSMDFLANNLEYDVPLQNLSYNLRRIPTLPKSKFIITNVRKRANSPDLP